MNDSIRPPSLSGYPTYLAAQLVKAAHRLLLDRLAEHDLRLHHFAVLAAMDDFGPQCQQDLCDRLDVDKSHMVGFIDDLNQRGLLTKQRDQHDRRRYRLAVTPEGSALLTHLHQAEAECQEVVFGALTVDQRQALTATLQTVVAQLDAVRFDQAGQHTGVSA